MLARELHHHSGVLMSHSLFMAFTGLNSRAKALDVAANNVANLSSPGFKKQLLSFSNTSRLPEDQTSEIERATNGSLVRVRTVVDMSPGELIQTGSPLNVALSGDGFFAVETPQGTRYTRNGSLRISKDNELVSGEGYPLLKMDARSAGKDSRIILPEGRVEISASGTVSVEGVRAGRMKIVSFEDTAYLSKVGGTLFEASPKARETVPSEISLKQGFLERANVNPVVGLAEMISIMRSFEMLSRAVRSISDNVDRKVLDDVARL